MHLQPLKPLNPLLHAAYVPALTWHPRHGKDPLPEDARDRVERLIDRRNETRDEAQLDLIDRELVAATYWYVLRPDEIARAVVQRHGFPSVLSVAQAATVLAAIGEAGYPIHGNGAPEYERDSWDEPHPVRGADRERVIWGAARHWAQMAARRITYVSLGDCRGYSPRAVQYDEPGSMNPSQQASLTLGPADDARSHAYMRTHTRKLLLVRGES